MTRPMFSWRHAVLKSTLPAGVRHVLLTLSCHMTDTGDSCFPSIDQLVKETGLSKSGVLKFVAKAKDDGWLKTERHGFSGQKWARHQYFVSWPDDQKGGACGAPPSEKGGACGAPPSEKGGVSGAPPSPKGGACGAPPSGPLDRSSTSFPPLISPPTLTSQGCAVPSDLTGETDDPVERTARWMLGKLRLLNPDHREPNWKRWQRELRLLVDRDKRSLPEIRDLFGWANADPFWQTNILSPGKLRRQWDTLTIKRKASAGALGQQGAAADYRCATHPDRRGRRSIPGHGWCCADCIENIEREAAHA
jgi:hypothetical protein